MLENQSHHFDGAHPKAGDRSPNDRAQITRAREAAEALFAPQRRAEPPANSPPREPEGASGQGPRKPRILRALSQRPGQGEPSARPINSKPGTAPAPDELPKPSKIPASHLPRIRTWLKYGMTVRQVAELYDVPAAAITRLLQAA